MKKVFDKENNFDIILNSIKNLSKEEGDDKDVF